MESDKMLEQTNDMKICNPNEYELTTGIIAPNGVMYQGIFNKEKNKVGYIHNKSYRDDDSFYSPYLLYKIGQKIGIEVPETELALVLHKNIDKNYYRDSYYESSIIYDKNLIKDIIPGFYDCFSYMEPEQIRRIYLEENKKIAKKISEKTKGNALEETIYEHVNSYIYFLKTRGNKNKNEYTAEEENDMKQELINRLFLGLKFGIHGKFGVRLWNNRNARLDSYYLSGGMLGFNVREEWIKEQLEKGLRPFKEMVGIEYPTQYGIMPNIEVPHYRDVLKHLYSKYPKQAEKAYVAISKFTMDDLKNELKSFSRMSDYHKEYAIRVFEIRDKEFERVHNRYIENKEDDGR